MFGFKYIKNNEDDIKKQLKFKCFDCGMRFNSYNNLYRHVEDRHLLLIDDDMTIDQYLYHKRNKKDVFNCVICKNNPVKWNQEKLKYERYCCEACRSKAREIAKRNMMKVYKKFTLLNDPDHQSKMLANRSISGKYKFTTDGGEIGYTGKYELDFLKLVDVKFKMNSSEIVSSPLDFIFYYDYKDKQHFYIPDFYIPEYNLLIEIKDSSEYPIESKEKSRIKDQVVIKENKCNYIKIIDMVYDDLYSMLKTLNDRKNAINDTGEYIFMVPYK